MSRYSLKFDKGFDEVICERAVDCNAVCQYREPSNGPVMENAHCGKMGIVNIIPYTGVADDNPNAVFRRMKRA